jgi:hypothetical protein
VRRWEQFSRSSLRNEPILGMHAPGEVARPKVNQSLSRSVSQQCALPHSASRTAASDSIPKMGLDAAVQVAISRFDAER